MRSPYAGTVSRSDFSESRTTLTPAKDQRAQEISHRSEEDIDAELNSVLEMHQILVLAQTQNAETALSSVQGSHKSEKQIDHIKKYVEGVEAENKLYNRILDLVKEEKSRTRNPRVSEMIDAYLVPCTMLTIAGAAGFTLTFGLIFSGIRGQMELSRWSSLIFAIGFTHSGFLQITMQFPYVRKQIHRRFALLLPFFVLWILLCNVAAVTLLYVAVVALDLRPELYHDKSAALVPKPYISADGNRIPGYIIAIGSLVIGIPWFKAVWRTIRAVRWRMIRTTLFRPRSIGGNSP
jgi:hypothetical protein